MVWLYLDCFFCIWTVFFCILSVLWLHFCYILGSIFTVFWFPLGLHVCHKLPTICLHFHKVWLLKPIFMHFGKVKQIHKGVKMQLFAFLTQNFQALMRGNVLFFSKRKNEWVHLSSFLQKVKYGSLSNNKSLHFILRPK